MNSLSSLGRDVAALLHKWADSEPHGVTEGELVHQHLRLVVAGMGVVPLVRTEPENDGSQTLNGAIRQSAVTELEQLDWWEMIGEEGQEISPTFQGL